MFSFLFLGSCIALLQDVRLSETQCAEDWDQITDWCYFINDTIRVDFPEACNTCLALNATMVFLETDQDTKPLKDILYVNETYWLSGGIQGISEDKEGFKCQDVNQTTRGCTSSAASFPPCCSFTLEYNNTWTRKISLCSSIAYAFCRTLLKRKEHPYTLVLCIICSTLFLIIVTFGVYWVYRGRQKRNMQH